MNYNRSFVLVSAALLIASTSTRASDDTDQLVGRFEISRFEVDGNTIIKRAELQTVLAPFTGRNRNFTSIQLAQEALEEAYRRRGYNLVRVSLPEQELNQGVVRFTVVEAVIGKISVEGQTHFSDENVKRSMPALQLAQTPNIAQVSANLKMANENPAKKISLKMQPGERDNEVNAILNVTDSKPWRVGLTLDNSGDGNTGKTRIGLSAQHANLTGRDDVASLQYNTTAENPSKVSVYGAGYHLPLYALGHSIDVFGSYSSVDSGTISAGIFNLAVSGKGTVLGARYNINFARRDDYESKMILGADYKAYDNSVSIAGTQVGNDVTVHPLSIGFTGTLSKAFGDTTIYVTAIHNIPGGEKGNRAAFQRQRADARADYTAFRYGANFSKGFASDWQMRLSLNGQVSNDALIAGEQFGAGGANSVRGFAERELSADEGRFVSAEIYSPNVCALIGLNSAQCRVLAFYDQASLTRKNPLAGEIGHQSISSAGAGLRLNVGQNASLQADVGRVLKAGGSRDKGDKRLHVTLALSY